MNKMIPQSRNVTGYNFGQLLDEILKKKGIKQKELSAMTNLSEAYISRILNNKRTPELKTLKTICDAIDIRLSYFLLKVILESEIQENTEREPENALKKTWIEFSKIVFLEDDPQKPKSPLK